MSRLRMPAGFAACLVILTLVASINLRDIAAFLHLPIRKLPIPYGGAILDNALGVLLVVAVAALLLRPGQHLWAELGLRWNGWRGPSLALLSTLPCWLGLWWLGGFNPQWDLLALLMLGLLFPLAEEIVFRGFGFIFVHRQQRWPWWLAALVQAMIFGAIHWWSLGGGGGMALQAFFMTGVGGLVFAWLNSLDDYTLWSGLALHVSLNLAWNVMLVTDATATGWQGITLRLSAAALSVLLLYLLRRRRLREAERWGAQRSASTAPSPASRR